MILDSVLMPGPIHKDAFRKELDFSGFIGKCKDKSPDKTKLWTYIFEASQQKSAELKYKSAMGDEVAIISYT